MKRFWKWTCLIFVLLCGLGYYGYNHFMDYAANQITQQILTKDEATNLLKQPEVQELIKDQTEKTKTLPNNSATPNQAPASPSSNGTAPKAEVTDQKQQAEQPLTFHSREEALKFMLSKFTMSELKDFAAMASGGLTPEKKAQIKEKLMSRLTPEEYQALKIYGLTEMQNQNK